MPNSPPLGYMLLRRGGRRPAYQPGPLGALFIRFALLIIIGLGLLLGLMIKPVPLAGLWVISPSLSSAVSGYVCGIGCALLVASYLLLESVVGELAIVPLLGLFSDRFKRNEQHKAETRYFLFAGLKLLSLGAAAVGWYMNSGGWTI